MRYEIFFLHRKFKQWQEETFSNQCTCECLCLEHGSSESMLMPPVHCIKNVGAVAELSSIIGNFCDHHGVLSRLSQEMWLRPSRVLEGVRNSFYFHATSGLSHTLLAGM